MSIVAIGALYVDIILTTTYYPREDEKLRASKIQRRRGGNCPNTLEVLEQLANTSSRHLSLSLITVLPEKSSAASQSIISELESYVNMTYCIHRENITEPASSYIIKSQSTDSRTIVNYNELPDMTVDEFTRAVSKLGHKATWFHFEGRAPEVNITCINYVRRCFPSARVSVEVEKPGRAGLQELANAADVVFYSKSWAIDRGYSSAETCLLEQSIQTLNSTLLVCTWGQDGAGAFDMATKSFVHIPAYTAENSKVIDPIGAGDTFIAGMLYALNCKAEWSISQQLELANRVAGLKITQEGFSGLSRALHT